jgi:uncharacterized protein (UPF0216 family)
MSERPSVSEEAVLMKWMRLEIGRINDGVVAERKRLSQLLREDRPAAATKGGGEHTFDKDVLALMEATLPRDLTRRLRLPILFYFDATVPDSCFLADDAAVQALRHLGDISPLRRMQNGRLWVAKPIAYAIMSKYPTTVQIVMR